MTKKLSRRGDNLPYVKIMILFVFSLVALIFVPYLSISHSKESGIIKFSLNYPFSMFCLFMFG